jgi:signal transduction histidine kinase
VEFAALAAASGRAWRTRRSPENGWAAAAFGSIAAIGLVALPLPTQLRHAVGPSDPMHWLIKVLLVVLFCFPYLLVRFLNALERLPRRDRRVADALLVVMVTATFALPRFEATHDHRRPSWLIAWLVIVVVEWGGLSLYSCVRLALAGRGQPNVVRRRMELLSLASFVLVLSLVPALSTTNSDVASGSHLAGECIGVIAGILFYLGIAPPAILRMIWRRPEERALRNAEAKLMSGATKGAVATAVLPHLPRLFAGNLALLTDRRGEVIGYHGLTQQEADSLAARLLSRPERDQPWVPEAGLLAIPLGSGVMAVGTGAYTVYFGREEADLLQNLAVFVDLALARAELFEQERAGRVALEKAHQELEDLVYSLSHDLKSPLISLLGYLDYMKLDCADGLGETGLFYAERMTASASYMTSLIEDLLTLSRVGRTQTDPRDVNLSDVMHEVTAAASVGAPSASFEVGELPTVSINPLRATELFTNLVDNALKHSGRSDVAIRVWSERSADGGVAVYLSDNGPGISPAYREKVFGIFERLGAPGRPGAGTGIGLAMCRKIVEAVGGTIAIVDGPAGVGTVFRLGFPSVVVRPVRVSAPQDHEALR